MTTPKTLSGLEPILDWIRHTFHVDDKQYLDVMVKAGEWGGDVGDRSVHVGVFRILETSAGVLTLLAGGAGGESPVGGGGGSTGFDAGAHDGVIYGTPWMLELDGGHVEASTAESREADLRAQLEKAKQALEDIAQWSDAYPLEVFPEPDFKKAHELLKAGGMTLDAISASNMRHVVEGVGKIAKDTLAPKVVVP